MADEEDIITTQPATPAPSEPQYVNAWDDILAEHEKTLERQKAEDQQRIDKLSKGRAYWIGANMLANVFAEAINAWGTGNGAPAMQLPEYNNEYMKQWKEADDRRHVNYQRMKDQYDRLRVGQIQREQQIADTKNQRAYTEQQQQNAWDRQQQAIKDREQRAKDQAEEEVTRKKDAAMRIYAEFKMTEQEAEDYARGYGLPLRIQRRLADEDTQRRIKQREIQTLGRNKDYDIHIGGVIVGASKESEYTSNLGELQSLVLKYIEQANPNPGDIPDSQKYGTGTEGYQRWRADKDKYEAFAKAYKGKKLDRQQLEELVKTYGLDKDLDFMKEVNKLAGVVKPQQQAPAGENANDWFDE